MNSNGARIAVAVIEVCKIYLPYINTLSVLYHLCLFYRFFVILEYVIPSE